MVKLLALGVMAAGMGLTYHALARARRLSSAERRTVVNGMIEVAKGPFGRSPVGLIPSLRGPEGIIVEFIYGVGGIFAGFGGFLFFPA
jgi:hypothetical protein